MESSPHPDVAVSLSDDHVATIVIDRGPENYLDVDLATGLADTIELLESEAGCRAIVLASKGKHFCAGARLSADDQGPTDRNPLYAQAARLFAGSVPIVAAVQGAAIGAGLGLALVADFRVGAPEARFAAPFARLGFHQGFGLSVLLPRVVGEQTSLDLLYTGRRIKGDEALDVGLLDRLVPLERLRDEAASVASDIAVSAPLAVRAIRQTMRGDLAEKVRRATDAEHAAQRVLRQTDDYREGVAAMAERRTPEFRGR
jgi:2-(1,2-epoxy-1,2-dihydrophenyl)acetyl-CoA isomerase